MVSEEFQCWTFRFGRLGLEVHSCEIHSMGVEVHQLEVQVWIDMDLAMVNQLDNRRLEVVVERIAVGD